LESADLAEPFRFGAFDSKARETEFTRCCRASTVPVARLFVIFIFTAFFIPLSIFYLSPFTARYRCRYKQGCRTPGLERNPAGLPVPLAFS
jgi:hypothetical protein